MSIRSAKSVKLTSVLMLAGLLCFPDGVAWAGPAAQFPPRLVRHPAGQIGEGAGGGLIENINIQPAPEYYLDYTVSFRSGFDWVPNGRPRGENCPVLLVVRARQDAARSSQADGLLVRLGEQTAQ